MWNSGVSICGRFLCLLQFSFLLWSSVTANDGLLPNGDFEFAPNPKDMKGTVVLGRYSLPKWQSKGLVEYITSGHEQRDMLVAVPEGAHAVRLGNEASISQGIKLRQGSYYSLTFSAARTCAQSERLNVSVPPFSGNISIQTVYSINGWDAYAWAFRAPSNAVVVIFHNPGVEEDPVCGPVLDAVAIKEMFPPKFTKLNLIKNGDFEEGPYMFPSSNSGVLLPPNDVDAVSPLPGWIVDSLKAVKYIDAEHFAVPQGRRAVELVSGKESAISQIVRTIPGKLYRLSFAVGDARNSCKENMIVEAFAGKETLKVPFESKGAGIFKNATLAFTASSPRTRVAFFSTLYSTRSDDFSTLCGPVIDQVKLFSLH